MNFDYRLFTEINRLAGHSKFLDPVMVGMAKYGVIIYAVVLLILWLRPGTTSTDRKLVLRAAMAALLALSINQVIGFVYFRPRPFAHHTVNMLVPKSPDPSFPSDHATGSSALTVSLAGSKPGLGVVLLIVTLLLMVSRVYVGTHYPVDVIGGALTGILGSAVTNLLWPYLDKFGDKLINLYERFTPI